MKTIIKKKIYQGRVELRDYEVERLIKLRKSVRVLIDNPQIPEHNEYMILTISDLEKGQFINTQFSKYNEGQTYLLRGYKWKGKRDIDEDTTINFDTKKRLSEMWKDVLKGVN